jgi:hypothetical protein
MKELAGGKEIDACTDSPAARPKVKLLAEPAPPFR